MKKFLGILVLGLFFSTNAFAEKVKPGSGPLKFNDETVKFFHIYITKKLNAELIKEYSLPGFSFNYSGKAFYANHFLIRGTDEPFIFQWDRSEVNLGPEKGLCSGPSCKYFAKKNKIVWKGAKEKISRKVTLEELKAILKELGFYDIGLAECVGDDCEEKQFMKKLPESAFTTPGFDFVCFNSCKERNDETHCRQQCSLQ